MKYCNNCGAPLSEGARFCNTCGTVIKNKTFSPSASPAAKHYCNQCGNPLSEGAGFCRVCGSKNPHFQNPVPSSSPSQDDLDVSISNVDYNTPSHGTGSDQRQGSPAKTKVPVRSTPAGHSDGSKKKTQKNGQLAILLLIILAAIILIVFAVIMLSRNRSAGTQGESSVKPNSQLEGMPGFEIPNPSDFKNYEDYLKALQQFTGLDPKSFGSYEEYRKAFIAMTGVDPESFEASIPSRPDQSSVIENTSKEETSEECRHVVWNYMNDVAHQCAQCGVKQKHNWVKDDGIVYCVDCLAIDTSEENSKNNSKDNSSKDNSSKDNSSKDNSSKDNSSKDNSSKENSKEDPAHSFVDKLYPSVTLPYSDRELIEYSIQKRREANARWDGKEEIPLQMEYIGQLHFTRNDGTYINYVLYRQYGIFKGKQTSFIWWGRRGSISGMMDAQASGLTWQVPGLSSKFTYYGVSSIDEFRTKMMMNEINKGYQLEFSDVKGLEANFAGSQERVLETVTITGNWLNIRSGPGENYNMLSDNSKYTKGDRVSIYAYSSNGEWGKVRWNGMDGWIYLYYTNGRNYN